MEMSNFFDEQGRTRDYDEAYFSYVEEVNPRRTQLIGKMAIFGWKLLKSGQIGDELFPGHIVPVAAGAAHGRQNGIGDLRIGLFSLAQ